MVAIDYQEVEAPYDKRDGSVGGKQYKEEVGKQ